MWVGPLLFLESDGQFILAVEQLSCLILQTEMQARRASECIRQFLENALADAASLYRSPFFLGDEGLFEIEMVGDVKLGCLAGA